ncbi:set domain containing protein [Sporothrix brasiliensis 5110]|uniref:Set domain containing protein n=1 Tax=Sporothrix brasiliensis 5110 TaxID=1398154 RepID=A0A0C2EJW3_9PEZI|nr:set domain containing protein [Sporothrix brasiliensis 5110]KIH86339.1 set domain containing protein [Sporothrix brasiliensis 5110]
MEPTEDVMRSAHELPSKLPDVDLTPYTDQLLQWFQSEHQGQIHKLVDQVPPHVIGRFFLMQQVLKGQDSAWAPYIATLPQPQNYNAWALPAVWRKVGEEKGSDIALALLKGTNAEVAAEEMRQRIDTEFRAAWAVLQDPKYTFALYQWAYCIFTSRSFRPSLVLTDEIKAVLTRDANGAAQDGSSIDPRHLAAVNHARLPEGCGTDDFSILFPALDIGNHDPRASIRWLPVVDASRQSLNSSTVLTPAPSGTNEHAIVFYTGTGYGQGQEVFNNYGSKTNSELLVGYGFTLPPEDNMHNDYVHLRKRGALARGVSDGVAGHVDTHPDFLLSLRPIAEPSSVVGRARLPRDQQVDSMPESRRSPGFSLIEDGLLWDMLSHMIKPEDRETLQRAAVAASHGQQYLTLPMDDVNAILPLAELREAIMDLVFQTKFSEDGSSIFAQHSRNIHFVLLQKFDSDLETLQDTDPPSYIAALLEDGEYVAKTRQERLAMEYREQYRAVLSSAVDALGEEMSNMMSQEREA